MGGSTQVSQSLEGREVANDVTFLAQSAQTAASWVKFSFLIQLNSFLGFQASVVEPPPERRSIGTFRRYRVVKASLSKPGSARDRCVKADVMPEREPEHLSKQARRCRSIAAQTLDARTRATLLAMAKEYEDGAASDAGSDPKRS